jgi:hypothetical protein
LDSRDAGMYVGSAGLGARKRKVDIKIPPYVIKWR